MATDNRHKALLEKIEALQEEADAREEAELQLKQQTEFLTLILESLDHPFYVVDANNYRVKLANSAALKSATKGEATCHALIHNQDKPCDPGSQPCPLEIIKRTKRPVVVEHLRYDSQGNPRNIEVHAHPVLDESGNVTEMIENIFDITERKLIETSIKESETKFRRVAESAKDAIITADRDGKIAFCNTAAHNMFGYSANELIGQPIGILMPQRFREAHERGMTAVVASGKFRLVGQTVELFGIRKDGCEFPVELSLSTWKSADERFYTGMIRDISKRKQYENELNTLIDKLKKSLAQVRQLSGLLPICASCKKIRDDKGYWNQIEEYIRDRSEAEFSHGICPECSQKLYPEFQEQAKTKTDKSS